jgi:hypothetical protein
MSFTIDPVGEDKFYLDHVIDKRAYFPFTGHIVLAWRAIAHLNSLEPNKTHVEVHVSFIQTLSTLGRRKDNNG